MVDSVGLIPASRAFTTSRVNVLRNVAMQAGYVHSRTQVRLAKFEARVGKCPDSRLFILFRRILGGRNRVGACDRRVARPKDL